MKLKHTLIVLMLLLAILTIASASATEDNNITQDENEALGEQISSDKIMMEYNLTQDENEPLMKPDSAEENTIGSWGNSNYHDYYDDDYYAGRDMGIHLLSKGIVAKGNPVTFEISYKLKGSFEAQIDGKNVECYYEYQPEDYVELYVDTTGIDLGEHNLTLKCTNSEYENLSGNYTIYIENVVVNVPEKVILNYCSSAAVTLPKDATGTITIKINGKTVCNSQDTFAYVSLNDELKAPVKNNTYTMSVSYSGDEKYPEYYKEFNLTVDYNLCINETFIYGDYIYKSYEYSIFGCDMLDKNKFIVTIDGIDYTRNIEELAYYYIKLPEDFAIGKHRVVVTYLGDKNYYAKTETATIEIAPKIYISPVYEWFYGKDNYISLTLPKNAKGNLTVYVDGTKCKSVKLKNGKATLSMRYAKPGTHNITAAYDGTDYNVETQSVIKDIMIDYLKNCEFNVNQNAHVFLYKAKTIKDNILVNFNGKNYTGKPDGDNLDVKLPKIFEVGRYSFDVLYVKNNKVLYKETGYFNVNPIYKVPATINKGTGLITIISSKEDANITVTIEDYSYYDSEEIKFETRLVNGTATVSLAKLKQGEYYITINYVSESCENYEVYKLKVVTNKLIAKDLTKYYGTSNAFNVKVTDLKGNPINGKYVKFYINNRYIKQVKTNKKGYATLNINPSPGKYKITATYSNAEITRNLVIKHVLSLGKVTVKKSAKQIVLKAYLKQGKKALANKMVTFKFNGKNYKVKTNKNGIAKLTISKTILKNLKVGKTVIYQATYLKDTIKRYATVIR